MLSCRLLVSCVDAQGRSILRSAHSPHGPCTIYEYPFHPSTLFHTNYPLHRSLKVSLYQWAYPSTLWPRGGGWHLHPLIYHHHDRHRPPSFRSPANSEEIARVLIAAAPLVAHSCSFPFLLLHTTWVSEITTQTYASLPAPKRGR